MDTCTNCGGPLAPHFHVASRKNPRLKFCGECGGLSEALDIGNPRTMATMLYDDGERAAVSWGGPILGHIVHKSTPPHGRFAPVRYRVRMLDGSMWHGTGPSSNGTYIRLRRMK